MSVSNGIRSKTQKLFKNFSVRDYLCTILRLIAELSTSSHNPPQSINPRKKMLSLSGSEVLLHLIRSPIQRKLFVIKLLDRKIERAYWNYREIYVKIFMWRKLSSLVFGMPLSCYSFCLQRFMFVLFLQSK